MAELREAWSRIRETALVIAQVVTLGVLAMTLGLIAITAVLSQQTQSVSASQTEPSRPLSALVPTLVPYTPTPSVPGVTDAADAEVSATPTTQDEIIVPTWEPPRATETIAEPTPTAPPPTNTPMPEPTATPEPPTATPKPPTSTPKPQTSPAGNAAPETMTVLPASDGLPARLRAEPTTKSPILFRVPLGTTVEVLGIVDGDELEPGNRRWVHIKWKGQSGYIYSTLVG